MMAPKISIVDPEWFCQRTLSENEDIIEVSDYGSYIKGHLAQARLLPWQATLNPGPLAGLPPPATQIAAILEHIEYRPQRHYWVYDDEGGGWAGRFLWILQLLGHQHLGYINGGKVAWQFHGLPLVAAEPLKTPAKTPTHSYDMPTLLAAERIIQDLATDHHYQYWDARSLGEYSGRRPSAARNGHIPGAVHLEWMQLMDQNQGFKIRQDAREIIVHAGLELGKPCITYCHSNHRSGFTFLVGRSVNMNIQPYPGAWSEWGNRTDTPIQ